MGNHYFFFFFFNDTATTEIYTLSLHDALPISTSLGIVTPPGQHGFDICVGEGQAWGIPTQYGGPYVGFMRSEEHTSELQSQSNLVCRLLLEKKKNDELRT